MKTYDGQTAKFLAVVGENMPEVSGKMMQWWIENPLSLQVVLRSLCTKPNFEVWKTIKLGTVGLKTAEDFRRALHKDGFEINDRASDILGKFAFTVATEETEVDLAKVTVAELGFKDGAKREQIYERAKELGLELCPAEVGPQLRLQYQDQPNGEWVLIGMKPIVDSDGDPNVFYMERIDSKLWLSSYWGSSDSFWHADRQWVFCRPRK
ncbi:MAG: hypothetical protein A2Z78_00285 [Candidatus Nealsonbacteria bacterium RBG_13_36_15]|uniref:Uncharacterized protein n=1 Tax=Candidatus Nealsonbacteria bacterium RBG_13_36_15 TaxID=1801660 RepID=A0A1G2DXN3_9BACT|nr:MAG: hypothetical protein A2Z78_00285 [Candidatus Nealsonbacteria bacterium RBG_13_36_15]